MASQGRKGRKIGRSKRNGHAAAYKNEKRREKSHARRIAKHLRHHHNDNYAKQMLRQYQIAAGIA